MIRVRTSWFWIALSCAWLAATPLRALEHEFPQPDGFVNDYADVIPPAQQERLESYLQTFEKQSGVEIAVVTIDSLQGGDIDDSAVRLFEGWGIGKRETDEGLLILAAIQNRQARIEVGYGLEGVIPDAFAGRVLREVLFPAFRKGDYAGGLSAGVAVLSGHIAEAKGIEITGDAPAQQVQFQEEESAGPLAWVFRLILLVLAVALFIKNPFLFLLLFGMGGRGGRISGGFGGGGFGGFGGGLSGGGGASGRW